MLKYFLRRLRDVVRGPSAAPILSPANRIIGLSGATLAPMSRLYVRGSALREGHIVLGSGVYLGRNVELATALGGDLHVGQDTSIQDNCVFHGDVRIGDHCLFAANVLISTTIHRFRDHPSWLIRDQDKAVSELAEKPADYSRPVVIEDDCWIGWGAAIMPGVTIGRGAIIGANCVVTSEVGPYEIHGGAPNRLLGKRLDFMPPASIAAGNDTDLPYFYRGFRLSQDELRGNRPVGVPCGHPRATLVLAKKDQPSVRIEGIVLDTPLTLVVNINGRAAGTHALDTGPFVLETSAPGADGALSGALAAYTVVELSVAEQDSVQGWSVNRYAIRSANLV